jgi:hypothetical protein
MSDKVFRLKAEFCSTALFPNVLQMNGLRRNYASTKDPKAGAPKSLTNIFDCTLLINYIRNHYGNGDKSKNFD